MAQDTILMIRKEMIIDAVLENDTMIRQVFITDNKRHLINLKRLENP